MPERQHIITAQTGLPLTLRTGNAPAPRKLIDNARGYLTIGARLQLVLKQAGISAEEASDLLGVHKHTIYRYFNLERSPKAEHVAAIIDMTGADAAFVLTGRSAPKPRHDQYQVIFAAMMAAQGAFEAVEAACSDGAAYADCDPVARRALVQAGKHLHELGGVNAMTGAYAAWYRDDPARTDAARQILNLAWSGIGEW